MAETATLMPPRAVSPLLEMGAYEALWDEPKASFKVLADKFRGAPGAVPSDFVSEPQAEEYANRVVDTFHKASVRRFGVRLNGAGEYPEKLRHAAHPVELLYFSGWWDLAYSPSVAVVGTRNPTSDGLARAQKLVRHLVEDDYTIVSGLAAGVDTEAHRTALKSGGRTIAVLGTPLSSSYPRENADLQRMIAEVGCVISQVPVCVYVRRNPLQNRHFFPARNVTMSALTQATIIVEAGETSGTLIQARAALHQGRLLFILDSCFRAGLKWPARYEAKGAIRVKDYDQIREHLAAQDLDKGGPADAAGSLPS